MINKSKIFSNISIVRAMLFAGMGIGVAILIVFLKLFGSPTENQLRVENSRLLSQYNLLSKELDQAIAVMKEIQNRDDNMYRVIFRANPISSEVRNSTFSGTNRYEELNDMKNSDLVINTTQKLDVLKKNIYIQSKSFDELVELYRQNTERVLYTPAIQPVSAKKMRQLSSGFGPRIDPIYGIIKFHQGLDFSADTGTEVYATANGTVVKSGWQQGYGNVIWIDHGFGYKTAYAHLSKIKANVGKKVIRGEIIGEVGSTGKSTSPHLHYEVHVNGNPVDPIDYLFMDITPDEYDRIIREANSNHIVLD